MSVRVIVADSDPTTVELISVVLTRRGFEVQATLEGLDALSRFLDTAPDLVICDQVLSGVNARELARQVKESRKDARVILLVPADTDEALRQELISQAGCDGTLGRPFRFRELADLLEGWGLTPKAPVATEDLASFLVPGGSTPAGLSQPIEPPSQVSRADASDTALAELPPMPAPLPLPIPVDSAASTAELQAQFRLSTGKEAPVVRAPARTTGSAGKAPASRAAAVAGAPAEGPDLSELMRPKSAGQAVAKAPASAGQRRPPTAEVGLSEIGLDAGVDTGGLPASVPIQGRLDQVPLPRLLFELYAATFTGVLQLVRAGVRRSLNFVGGVPVRVDSRQLGENLGQLLVEHGRITQAQYDAAQQLIDTQGLRQGQALVAVGAISEADLADALQEQTELKVANTLAWRDGEYLLVPDSGSAERETFGEINPLRAIWRGVREHYDSPSLEAFFAQLATRFIVGVPTLAAQQTSLGPLLRHAEIPALLDGKTTFAQALPAGHPRLADRLAGLYVLLVTDLVRPSDTPGTALQLADTSGAALTPRRQETPAAAPAPPQRSPAALEAERLFHHGAQLRQQGDLAGARDAFLAAVQADLAEPAYRVALADIVWRADPTGDAARQYAWGLLEQALQLDPGSVDACLVAARISLQAGALPQAKDLAQRVLQRVPDHPEARAILASTG